MRLEGESPQVLLPREKNQGAWDMVRGLRLGSDFHQLPPVEEGFMVRTLLQGGGR